VTVASHPGPGVAYSITASPASFKARSVHNSIGQCVSNPNSDIFVSAGYEDDAAVAMRMQLEEYGIVDEKDVRSAAH
jgi:hypothetical protein